MSAAFFVLLIAPHGVSRKTVRESDPNVSRVTHVEPFSIQCQSCQARLKVTKPALLGKRLPCPKCQSPVVVPETQQATDQHDSNADAQTQEDARTAAESLGGFEDVDDLLSQLPADPAAQQKFSPTPRTKSRPEATERQTSATEPIQPDVSWDNPAVAKTRRTLALAAAAIGVILLAAIGSYAWFSSAPKTPIAKVAENDLPPSETAPPDRVTDVESSDVTRPELQEPDSETGAQPDSVPNEMPDSETVSKESENSATEPLIASSQPPPIDMTEPPPTVNQDAGLSVNSPVPKPATEESDAVTGPPISSAKPAPKSSPASKQILQPVAPASSALSELSALLEESGSSISAITDATASATATETIGLPKYYFQASNLASVDIDRQLGQPCAGLRYRDVPIIEILRDVTAISGIPISIDAASLVGKFANGTRTGDQRLLPNVSVDIVDTDFRKAIKSIAQGANWTITINEVGVVLTDAEAFNPLQKTVDLTPIAVLGDDGLDGVVDSIKAMIAADSWFADDQPYRLERNGMSLTVHHFPPVVRKVEQFIDRVFAAIQLTQSDAANKEALKEKLATRLSLAESNLSASCELEISSRSTLDHLLNRIREKTGVDVIANWQTLATLEWTPQMTVPGNVSEPTLDKMLRQLERSMDATAIVLDAHTIELTHPLDALRRGYVEFYLISDLLQRNFTPQRAIQLVQQAIENAGRPAAMTIYDPQCECIVLAGPQSTHRVVEAVLKEIK
jgi:hypothetical protein